MRANKQNPTMSDDRVAKDGPHAASAGPGLTNSALSPAPAQAREKKTSTGHQPHGRSAQGNVVAQLTRLSKKQRATGEDLWSELDADNDHPADDEDGYHSDDESRSDCESDSGEDEPKRHKRRVEEPSTQKHAPRESRRSRRSPTREHRSDRHRSHRRERSPRRSRSPRRTRSPHRPSRSKHRTRGHKSQRSSSRRRRSSRYSDDSSSSLSSAYDDSSSDELDEDVTALSEGLLTGGEQAIRALPFNWSRYRFLETVEDTIDQVEKSTTKFPMFLINDWLYRLSTFKLRYAHLRKAHHRHETEDLTAWMLGEELMALLLHMKCTRSTPLAIHKSVTNAKESRKQAHLFGRNEQKQKVA